MPNEGLIVIKFVACFGRKNQMLHKIAAVFSYVNEWNKNLVWCIVRNEEIITTPWGKGYQINEQILSYLEQTLFETVQ